MTKNDMKMGWISDNDEENHKYKSKMTAFEIQTWGIHPPSQCLRNKKVFLKQKNLPELLMFSCR